MYSHKSILDIIFFFIYLLETYLCMHYNTSSSIEHSRLRSELNLYQLLKVNLSCKIVVHKGSVRPEVLSESHQEKHTKINMPRPHSKTMSWHQPPKNHTHTHHSHQEVHQTRHDRPSHSMTISVLLFYYFIYLFFRMPRIWHCCHPQSLRHLQRTVNEKSLQHWTTYPSIRSPLWLDETCTKQQSLHYFWKN